MFSFKSVRVPGISGMVLLAASGAAVAQVGPQMGSPPVMLEGDVLQFSVGQSFQRDSNIFRLSDQVSSQAVIGNSERGDTVGITTAGFRINKPYSLQRFEIGANVERYHYSRFSNLNFNAVNYAAAWRWSLTPAFRGNLSTDQREYIDNYADIQNQGRVNRRTDRFSILDGQYDIDGRWSALGGLFQRDTKSSAPQVFQGDPKVTGTEVGARYQFPYATSLAYRFKNAKGEYGNSFSQATSGGDFKDREHELRGEWSPGGRTTLTARLAHLKRTHDTLPARDFSGVIGQADWNYEFTAKTSAAAGVVRELGSYQTNNASYYEGTRFFIAPTYRATEKISLRARYDFGVRDFKGPLPGFADTGRRDRLYLASLSAEYQILRQLKVRGWVQQDKRTSNELGADYKSNAVGIAAEATF
jgi:exopolysaccharide biosynthesis operon protein EpsL